MDSLRRLRELGVSIALDDFGNRLFLPDIPGTVAVPALIGPICGPPLGGFITTYATWHWIFIINVPIGLVGIALATRFIPDIRAQYPYPFDLVGFISGVAIGGLSFGLSMMGLAYLPNGVVAALIGVGASRGPPTYSTRCAHRRRSLICGCSAADISRQHVWRLHVPARRRRAAVFVAASAAARLRAVAVPVRADHVHQRARLDVHEGGRDHDPEILYRNVLLYNSVISAVFIGACATFVHGMPFAAMIAILLVGGFFRSLQFTSVNTIAYAEIDAPVMSRATSMVAAFQQLSLSTGVAIGALVVELTLRLRHSTAMSVTDFPPAFLAISLLSAAAALIFMQLPTDAGAELSGRQLVRQTQTDKLA